MRCLNLIKQDADFADGQLDDKTEHRNHNDYALFAEMRPYVRNKIGDKFLYAM